MSNANPLQRYALGQDPPVTNNSVIVDGVYAVNGVIDTIGSNTNSFFDPASNQIKVASPTTLQDTGIPTAWTSGIVDDEVHNQYTLSFKFNTTTYINQVRFDILSVPCTWTLYRNSTPLTVGIIDQYDTSSYIHTVVDLGSTYKFDVDNSLVLVLTKTVTNTQYQFGLKNFLTKLKVLGVNDVTVDNTVVSGITTQNNLGFIETYNPTQDLLSNITDSDVTNYWKCSPQPVGDAVVFFTVDLGQLQTLNRLYIDPLYSGTVFNLYWSYDGVNWTSVQRDFNLRRGIYELPTINARYLKFEFTQLTAEPYQLPFDYIDKTIQVFPDWVDNYYGNIERSISNIANQTYSQSSAIVPNTSYNTQIVSKTLYGSAFDNLGDSAYGASPSVYQSQASRNTTSITDPTVSYKTLQQVNSRGSTYNPISDISFITRRFPLIGSHTYKTLDIRQTWHHAYFTGIKQLKIYNTNYTPQLDYPEFTDYFMSAGANTIVSGAGSTVSGTTMSFRTPSIISMGDGTTVSGGGYIGGAGTQLLTKNLSTLTQYESFKFAMLSSEWTGLLTSGQITLQSTNPTSLDSLGITTSSGMTVQSIPTYSNKYSVYELTPSGGGAQNYSFIKSGTAGGQNLLTVAEANFTSGGWQGTNPYTNTTISGLTNVTLDSSNLYQWGSEYGDTVFGGDTFGASTTLGNSVSSSYIFLVTASGSGSRTITPSITFSGTANVGGVLTASGYTTSSGLSITGVSGIAYPVTRPSWATQVSFQLTNTGTDTYSRASFAPGDSSDWVSPLVTSGMRMSAMARIYLPSTNRGSYRCSLYSGTTELASRQFSNLPTKTWVDVQVPFTLTSGYYSYNKFNVQLTQTNGQGEKYRIALLGVFYNPVAIEYCSDGSGTNWNWITAGVNDPYTNINLRGLSNQLQFRATILQDGSTISAMSAIPNYTQNPFYSTVPIEYLGDTKTNELSWKRTPAQRPLFQLGNELFPVNYDMTVMMNILRPFTLG